MTQPLLSASAKLLLNVAICNRLAELKPQQDAKVLKTVAKQSDDEVFTCVGRLE
jgi:hypothetical protein